jgi:hypothetical protein
MRKAFKTIQIGKFMKIRQIAGALAVIAASASSHAGVIYDSANGGAVSTANASTDPNGGNSGFLTSVIVNSAVTINQIEQLTYANGNSNYQWVIYSAGGSLLFASAVSSVASDAGAITFANATYKASSMFSYTLNAGTYRIGAVTDSVSVYFGELNQNNAAGLIQDGVTNYNTVGFNNPAANPGGGYCCDTYIRLSTIDGTVPEPGSAPLLLAALPALWLMRRRRKSI